MLGAMNEETTVGFIVFSLVVLGSGFPSFSSPTINAVMSSVEHRFYGVASGTLGTMRGMGMVFSMGITLWLFSMYIGKVQITPEDLSGPPEMCKIRVHLLCRSLFRRHFCFLCKGQNQVNAPRTIPNEVERGIGEPKGSLSCNSDDVREET